MAVLSLPLTFTNSFWTQDYRRGLEVLYGKLEQGIAENDEIIAFIRSRANAEIALATALSGAVSNDPPGTGFAADDGASLLMAFRGLQAEASKQGDAHRGIANELRTLVADPFAEWADGHKDRIRQSKAAMLQNFLWSYEHAQADVEKLKNVYLSKTRRADEAEDDARFAPGVQGSDKYTTTPQLGAHGPPDNRTPRQPPARTPSVSERIANRLREIQKRAAGDNKETTSTEAENADEKTLSDEPTEIKLDKGKEKETLTAEPESLSPAALSPTAPSTEKQLPVPPPPLSIARGSSPMPPPPPSPIVLAGLSLPPSAVSALLTRAKEELPLRPIKVPILGEYPDCFSGEEFVNWLTESVQAFSGSWDKAEEAARQIAEEHGLLRRIGEIGNNFEAMDDAYYQFRPKAFELGETLQVKNSPSDGLLSPNKRSFATTAETLVKRSNNFVNLVQRAINTNQSGDPPYIRARIEAEEADKEYRVAVRKLDRQRLGLEERIEEALKNLQRWEADRLRAVKTVLLQYQGTIANLPKALEPSNERSGTLIAAFQPESDLTALIERYRTGPFRPSPQVYESIIHDESDVVFGIDLRKWAEGGWDAMTNGSEKRDQVPPVLTALLYALEQTYAKLPSDAEKRKAWIYEVPLAAVHHLRESIHGLQPEAPIPDDLLLKYDAPVLASAVKLWALELDPPLALWEGWDDIRRIYPPVGAAKSEGEKTPEQRVQELQVSLQRLPKVHLYVLDAILQHLNRLISSTKVDEPEEVYITKLALTMGRAICRPKFETDITIQDRHPTHMFIDLLKHYPELLPPTIAKKKRESERRIPIRKRTAPIDMRMHRSRLSVGGDARAQVAAQEAAKKAQPPVPEILTDAPEPSPPKPVDTAAATTEAGAADPAPTITLATPQSRPATSPVGPKPPAFKSPPPEKDDGPARPSFQEPKDSDEEDEANTGNNNDGGDGGAQPTTAPEPTIEEQKPENEESNADNEEADGPPPMPTFAPPPPEVEDAPSLRAAAPSSPASPSIPPSPGGASDDRVLAARSSLSRSGSSEASRVRGPRGARGPSGTHTPSGSVSSRIANLEKAAAGGPPSPGHRTGPSLSRSPAPAEGAAAKRLSRNSALSRKTPASDAEE